MSTKPRRKSGPSGASTPRALRTHVAVEVTLPPDAHAALRDLAERWGTTRSGAVARAVLEAAGR